MENSQTTDSNVRNFDYLDEEYKHTSIGCLIGYLRAHSPTPKEILVDYFDSKRHLLTNADGKRLTKSAIEIVNLILDWRKNIFKQDSQLCYYLDEEEALNHENHFKAEKLQRSCHRRKREEIIKERMDKKKEIKRRSERIKSTIENDLKGPSQNYSTMTRVYLTLISDDTEKAVSLKKLIRETYIALIRS